MFYRCFLLPWHHVHLEVVFDKHNRKLRCSCGRAFGMNDNVQAVVPWDNELEEMYKSFGYVW